MSSLISRVWRTLATAFCFAMFGLGGAIIAVLIAPPLILLIRDPARRRHVGKEVISGGFRVFINLMCITGVMTYQIRNRERLEQPGQLILANHPSLIDTIFLIAFARNADCVVKGKLLDNPFTRGPIRLSGYLLNSSPDAVIEEAGRSIRSGNNLIVFPEGTRTTAGQRQVMKRGAANIAIKTGTDIRPVVIHCDPPVLTKEIKWYQVPPQKVRMTLDVQPTIPVASYSAASNHPRAARELTRYLENYFNNAVPTATPDVPADPPDRENSLSDLDRPASCERDEKDIPA